MTTATTATPPRPHPATWGWRPGQEPPAGFLDATQAWLDAIPMPTPERLAAVQAWEAAAVYRSEVQLAQALMLLALTDNLPEPAGEGLVWRDWATLKPADWLAHDRMISLVRATVATPDADRTDAIWDALVELPEKYQRLFDDLDEVQAAADGMEVTDPAAKPGPALEAARRRVAGRAGSTAARP
jgi:hypothetical protein